LFSLLNLFLVGLLVLTQLACRPGLIESVLEVRGARWERVVYLEEYKTVTADDWADELPKGVKKISSKIVPKGTTVVLRREEYNETEKYPCGSSMPVPTRPALPAKTCERTVKKTRNLTGVLPEDREMMTYETKQWQEADKSKASIAGGDETQPPVWTEPQVDNKMTRAGRRSEYYSLTLAGLDGETKTYNYQVTDFEEWKSYQKGQRVKATFFSADGQPLTITKIN